MPPHKVAGWYQNDQPLHIFKNRDMLKKRLISLQDIFLGEKGTIKKTNNVLLGCCKYFPICVDSLLKLPYFIDQAKDIESPEGSFHSYCHTQYLIAPYSFRSCYILWERGHYSEASVIIRSILESFVQIRYLYQHKEKTKTVWISSDIKMWTMFESLGVSRDFYDRHYGRILSGISHCKIASDMFRVKRKSATKGRVIMIPGFDLEDAGYIANYFTALIAGYLNFFKVFFPERFQLLEKDSLVFSQHNKSIDWLSRVILENKKQFPIALGWYKDIDKITIPFERN